ncbi:EAL domain-containing protein [Frateuria aurantia]
MAILKVAEMARPLDQIDTWFSDVDLMDCFQAGQVFNVAQPVVGADGMVTGIELLLRINYPGLGALPAGRFMRNIVERDSYFAILQASLDSAERIIQMGIRDVIIAINISEHDLLNPGVFPLLKARAKALIRSGCSVVFEISESIDFATNERLEAAIQKISRLGYDFTLDDFLSAYSTTFPIRNFDLKAIKLDMGICNSYRNSIKDFALIKTIVYYCRLMGVSLIAEGVEERDQFIELRAMGIQKFQGYLFSRPVEIERLVSRMLELGYAKRQRRTPISGASWRDAHDLSVI